MHIAKLNYLVANGDLSTGNFVPCVIVSVAWYTYRMLQAKLIVHYEKGFLTTLHACLMPHALYITQQSHSFIQFSPVSYYLQPYSPQTDQNCSQTQSTIFPQCHRPSVTPTTITMLCKHTHIYTSIASFLKAGWTAQHYEAALWISSNPFHLNFFTFQSLLLIATPK
jgi:hypothetical protein